MELLGETLPEGLAAFYEEVARHFAAKEIELYTAPGDGPEFGGFYREEGKARVEVRQDLKGDAFCHTLAHELAHGLQRDDGWPLATANPDLGEGSSAEEVASVLQAMVHCAGAELRIAPLGLDASLEQNERHSNVRYMLRAPHAGTDIPGTPAWGYWSLLYAYLAVIHPEKQVRTLLRNFERAIPVAADAGKRAAEIVRREGYATREQALASLRGVRDALNLAPHVLITDPREGAVY